MQNIQFHLDDRQMKELEEWREKIRDLHGEKGQEEFRFSPIGIGTICIVKNTSLNIELNLTHEEDW